MQSQKVTQINRKAFRDLHKIQGNTNNISHQLREPADSFLLGLPKKPQRSLWKKRSDYKSIPLEKLIVLPPDYKMGKLKLVTPIKSSDEKSFIFKNEAGSLILPKSSIAQYSDSSPPISSRSSNSRVNKLNLLIKEISDRNYPKSSKKFKIPSKVFLTLNPIKKSPDYKKLPQYRQELLERWSSVFDNF